MKYPLLSGLLLGMAVCVGGAAASDSDLAGSADHPLLGRYEGTWIAGYQAVEFDASTVATGKVDAAGDNALSPEGRLTRIVYHIEDTVSVLQLFRNYELKLADAGFETLFSCAGREECGHGFRKTVPSMPIPLMWGGEDYRYIAARLARPEGDVYAAVICESLGGSGKRACQVDVIEQQAMTYKMIDADAMAKAITETGSIALYGIYFDTGKAKIKPESAATIGEVARLLKERPELKLVIVGHTDNQGAFDYNMDLSKRRAEAVEQALIAGHAISAARLRSWGVGYLSPVASNRDDAGRALNRRVQLVEQ